MYKQIDGQTDRQIKLKLISPYNLAAMALLQFMMASNLNALHIMYPCTVLRTGTSSAIDVVVEICGLIN